MAKRDKLTQRQQRQVVKNQHKRFKNSNLLEELGELSESKEGLMVSRYGEQADIIDKQTLKKYRCYLRQNLGSPVPGDHIQFRLDNNNHGVVELIHERQSLIQRPSPHQGLKPVAANIELIFVIIAPLPDFSATLLDRYLVAIAEADIPAHIIANKWELRDEIEQQNIEEQLKIYQSLNYPVTHISTKTEQGLDEFIHLAQQKKSVLVGQSGVGKSSIINKIFPEQHSHVNEVSENSRLGQHTTTASQLFLFKNSTGFIIDSPGIREFGLWHLDSYNVAKNFVEFLPLIGTCKYRDCKHINEPGCKIIEAVKNHHIHESRWQSYCKILKSLSQS